MDAVLQTIPFLFFYSMPSMFIITVFSLVFWGADYRLIWKRSLFLAIFQPILGDLSLTTLPSGIHMLLYLVIWIIFFFSLFREFSYLELSIMLVFAFVFAILNEFIATVIDQRFNNFEERFNFPWISIMNLWPLLLIYSAFSIHLVKKDIHPGKRILAYLKRRKSTSFVLIILFLFIQFVIAFFLLSGKNVFENVTLNMLIILEIITFIIFFLLLRTISQVKEQTVNQTQDVYLNNIDNMFTTIRGQRHDFLNHVQVLRAMIERNKLEDFMRYSKDLIGEIDEVNEIIHIGHPAISALIQSKVARSISEKVKFTYIFSGLSQLTSGVKTIDIVKIMANLLDNAFDEVSELPVENRWVDIEGHVENGTISISVKNPMRAATENELAVLFQSGFTTKDKSKHSGLGLSIVKENVERYKGKIALEKTSQNEVVFQVTLTI